LLRDLLVAITFSVNEFHLPRAIASHWLISAICDFLNNSSLFQLPVPNIELQSMNTKRLDFHKCRPLATPLCRFVGRLALIAYLLTGAFTLETRSLHAGEPSKAMVGLYFNSIRDIDWATGRFKADIYWWIRHPADMPEETKKVVERIEFVNVDLDSIVQEELDRLEFTIDNRLQNLIIYRAVGDFHFSTDFSRYPFDQQTVYISLEHKSLSNDKFLFEVDWLSYKRFENAYPFPGISPSLGIPDFNIAGVDFTVKGKQYTTDFGDINADVKAGSTFSNLSVSIRFQRQYIPYLVKILVPIIICLILPYMVFFLPGAELEVAVGLTVTSLLTCVAIQLTVVPGLPSIGYVATSDLIFYLAYLLAMLAMAQTVWTYNLTRRGHEAFATKMDKLFRLFYPLVFIVGIAIIVCR
jgi:hypothetical protein